MRILNAVLSWVGLKVIPLRHFDSGMVMGYGLVKLSLWQDSVLGQTLSLRRRLQSVERAYED